MVTNLLYFEAHPYFFFQLEDVSHHCIPRKIRKICNVLKPMSLMLSVNRFLEEKPIIGINFLTQFVRKANIKKSLEAETLVALLSFLSVYENRQNKAGTEMVSPEKGGLFSLAEGIQMSTKKLILDVKSQFSNLQSPSSFSKTYGSRSRTETQI